MDFESVAVLHVELCPVSNWLKKCSLALIAGDHYSPTYRVWVVCSCYALTVEQESYARDVLSLAVAESVHELAKGSGALDLEEDLVVVVGDLDVEVLGLLGSLVLVGGGGRGRRCRHGEGGAKVVSGRVVWIFVDEGARVSQAEETVLRWGMSAQMLV